MKEKLHTADHILYTILNSKYQAETRAMEFADDFSRVDYISKMDLISLKDEIENDVSKIIKKGLSVKSFDLPREEAKKITDLGLIPKSVKNVTIYEIESVNKLACQGPHVKNTSEIDQFKILKIKKNGKDIYSVRYTVK